MFRQTSALGLLVAVISISTFVVDWDILECSELMIGGREHIRSFESKVRHKHTEDKGINWAIADDRQILLELVILQQFHKAIPIHLLGVIERHKLERCRILRSIPEWSINTV